jgi:KipI family sensor histidine kinase inhibitor
LLLDCLRAWPGVVDVVVAREDVAVCFAGEPHVEAGAIGALAGRGGDEAPARTVEIAAVYDGPDLADVARAAGLREGDVARLHGAATYEVETMGFAPGFAYLSGLDSRLQLPRRATPRTRVPAGTIAVAGAYTGVYPFDSPGGWHLIGRVVGVRMFDEGGALLGLGDRVRFVS